MTSNTIIAIIACSSSILLVNGQSTTKSPSSISTSTPAPSQLSYFESAPAPEESQLLAALQKPDLQYKQDLYCGTLLQCNETSNGTAYYKFTVTSITERPITFSTCYGYDSYYGNISWQNESMVWDEYLRDTWMYLFYKKPGAASTVTNFETIDYIDDVYGDYFKWCAEMTHQELPDGEYVLAVGNYYWKYDIGFPMEVECGDNTNEYTPGQGELAGVIIAVVFVALFCVTIFMIFYCKQMKKFKADHRSLEKKKSPHHEQNGIKFQEVVEHDIEDDYDGHQSGIILTETRVDGSGVTDLSQIPEDIEYSAHSDESHEDGDKDKIRQIVSNIIQSCENESDLDIYQVLAFRRLDAKSWKLRLFKPFEPLGIDYELLNISAYHKSIFVAIVVSILQCVGITVILFSATHSYFNDEDEDNQSCHWTIPDWNKSWHFKLLAFLWCIVITLKVSIDLKKFKANGFTQVIDRVSHNEYHKFYKIVNLNIVQIGYLVNLYTLLVAVFGSYWIVYASEQGSESVEMVLNAVALFFMIELDDILVTDKDYYDIKTRMKEYLQRYDIIMGDVDDQPENEEKVNDEKQLNRLIRVSVGTKYCSYFITAITIIGGAIAPWIILLCYG